MIYRTHENFLERIAMIIDARNLNIHIAAADTKAAASQTGTNELIRNLDRAEAGLYVRQDTLESILSRNVARVDVYSSASADNIASKIKLVRTEEAFEKDYTAEDASLMTNSPKSRIMSRIRVWYATAQTVKAFSSGTICTTTERTHRT